MKSSRPRGVGPGEEVTCGSIPRVVSSGGPRPEVGIGVEGVRTAVTGRVGATGVRTSGGNSSHLSVSL